MRGESYESYLRSRLTFFSVRLINFHENDSIKTLFNTHTLTHTLIHTHTIQMSPSEPGTEPEPAEHPTSFYRTQNLLTERFNLWMIPRTFFCVPQNLLLTGQTFKTVICFWPFWVSEPHQLLLDGPLVPSLSGPSSEPAQCSAFAQWDKFRAVLHNQTVSFWCFFFRTSTPS